MGPSDGGMVCREGESGDGATLDGFVVLEMLKEDL
jgi:hypothetical protein